MEEEQTNEREAMNATKTIDKLTMEDAAKLIKSFASNQVRSAHQCNRKGVQNKGTAKEERKLIAELLERLTDEEPTPEQIESAIFC